MTSLEPQVLVGLTAIDATGDKIGKVGNVYLDDRTGQPAWVTVSTGLFGTRQSFAPLDGARIDGDDLVLAVAKSQVKDAPNIDDDGHLSEQDQLELHRFYADFLPDRQPVQQPAAQELPAVDDPAPDSYADVAAAGSPVDNGAMTRSEERLSVGTEQVESGRARLRKFVVTENVTQTVPVTHEEVRIVREPVTGTDTVPDAQIGEQEHEITLHAERPVVSKETVAVERVSLGTETVTEEQTVTEQLRKEQIDSDADGAGTLDR